MEIKSKFERGDYVFTIWPGAEHGNETVIYIVIDVAEYSAKSGFTYKLLRSSTFRRAVDKKLTLQELNKEYADHCPFDYIREEYLFKNKEEYLSRKQLLADQAEQKIKEMESYPSIETFFGEQLYKD